MTCLNLDSKNCKNIRQLTAE